MPYTSSSDAGDFEKLQAAFAGLTSTFGSVDNLLEAFGLTDLPVAQRYGILVGCVVFFVTVSSVVFLLVFGGSFERIAEQAKTGKATVASDYRARTERPLLLERLLDARERLLQQNYAKSRPQRKEQTTKLTEMLLNVPPPTGTKEIQNLAVDSKAIKAVNHKDQNAQAMSGYMENFVMAYRKCQDKPGGAVIPGKPEARYEAYARAYAGCGDDTSLSYRRSYSRLYESICCESDKTDNHFEEIFQQDSQAIVGRTVRLEGLDAKKHLKDVYGATSGDMYCFQKSYDSAEVWGFLEDGPFNKPDELRKSFVFQHHENQAAFAIVQNLNNRILGVVMLKNDDPTNLSIQLDPPIVGPSSNGTLEQLEACYLLMDRLFANGYRRLQFSIDALDGQASKLADRLGFTFEGCLLKQQIVKDSSRDSNIYGMLNSDWTKGARIALYRKLYGKAMAKADLAYDKKEEELDEQQRVLAEKRQSETKK